MLFTPGKAPLCLCYHSLGNTQINFVLKFLTHSTAAFKSLFSTMPTRK